MLDRPVYESSVHSILQDGIDEIIVSSDLQLNLDIGVEAAISGQDSGQPHGRRCIRADCNRTLRNR
ncbi:hypothetical protein D3C86_2100200 [compost metagenome]